MEYKFVTPWDENTTQISWQKNSRIELNKIIREYNEWQIDGFDPLRVRKVLAMIEYGKQTIGKLDGGSGYLEELEDMEEFVKERLKTIN